MTDLEQLFAACTKWSEDRLILKNGRKETQFLKLVEEFGELGRSIMMHQSPKDDIGDCLVVLNNLCEMSGFRTIELPAFTHRSSVPTPLSMEAILARLGVLGSRIAKQQDLLLAANAIALWLQQACVSFELSLEECLEHAYNEIKDRRGHLNSHGVFVKEEEALR